MKQNQAKRRLAQILALTVCLSTPMQAATFAEENSDIMPIQQGEIRSEGENTSDELPVPADQPVGEEPESEQEPQAETTSAPQASPEVEETIQPEATPAPEESPSPEPETTPDPGEDVLPDITIEPEESLQPDITAEPTAEPTPEPTRNPYEGWYGVLPSDERGMAIPILYQTDYPEIICTIRGIDRSVETSGCGATCISMVIAYLTGNNTQNPHSIFVDAYETGRYTGEGFTHGMISHYAEKYGVRGEWIGKDGDAIVAALQKGMPVIAHMGPGIFTDNGHYVVLRGVTEDGDILLNDPVSPYKTVKSFPLKTILTQCKGYTPFMICWNEALEEEYENLKKPAGVQHTLEEIALELKRPISEIPSAVEVTTELVNLRDRPGKGDVVGTLPMGAKAWAVEERIMESGAFWYGIACDGQTLYLKSEYISETEATQEEIALLKESPLYPEPIVEPTAEPVAEAAAVPTAEPSAEPTAVPAAVPTVIPVPAAVFEPCAAEVTADRVNLRVSPGSGEITKCLKQGAQVYVVEERVMRSGAIWYGVIFEGETLYLKGEYMTLLDVDEKELERIHEACLQPEATPAPTAEPTPAPAAEPTPAPTAEPTMVPLSATMDGEMNAPYIAYVACDSANLRDHIGTNAQESLVICSVPAGTAMYVIDEELCYEDGYVWCKVIFRGQKLYVRGDLLQYTE